MLLGYYLTMTTILLAAGLSSRMGRNKLLLPYNGKTIIENTLLSVLPLSKRVIVVTGNERESVEKLLMPYGVEFVFNEEYEKGQRGSTIKGLRAVKDDDFAILPSDLPLLEEKDVSSLFDALKNFSIVRPVYNSIPGHPVCYRRENLEKLLSFSGTMKEYVKKEGVKLIPSSIGTVYDTDTPSRYSALLSFNGNLSVLESNIDESVLLHRATENCT